MFTARHDTRVWSDHLVTVLPISGMTNVSDHRDRIRQDIEDMRKHCNRIAHHEPIFTRNLHDDLLRMLELIDLHPPDTGQWVPEMEEVRDLLGKEPSLWLAIPQVEPAPCTRPKAKDWHTMILAKG